MGSALWGRDSDGTASLRGLGNGSRERRRRFFGFGRLSLRMTAVEPSCEGLVECRQCGWQRGKGESDARIAGWDYDL